MSKVGIVILNYNDYEETWNFIDRVKDYKSLSKIVIVDNNSTDSSFDKLKKLKRGNISVIKTNENKGYAYGNNVGIKFLNDSVDYIIISNPDIIVEEKAIRELRNALDENPDLSVVAPVIKQNNEYIKGWRLPRVIDEIGMNLNYFHRKVEKSLRYDDKKYNSDLTKVDVVSGCFFMIRRDTMNLIGNFDESTFLFYEENILAAKLKAANKKTCVDNKAVVIHNESATINKNMASINKYKRLKDSQKYFVKYYLHANIFEMFILRLVYRISLIIAYIVYFIKRIFKRS